MSFHYHNSNFQKCFLCKIAFIFLMMVQLQQHQVFVESFSGIFTARGFLKKNYNNDDRPKLILIGGCSGTGKSTFGMTVALDQGILKCISTDTLRSVMRSFIAKDISPALHRSSYASSNGDDSDDDDHNDTGKDDPVRNWLETCNVLKHSVEDLVDEMIERRVSLVVEGVHLVPSTELIQKWEASGGVALGIMLTVSDEEAHKKLLLRRGMMTGKGEEAKLRKFHRIRAIHDEMVRLAAKAGWMLVEQNLAPDPLDLVTDGLFNRTPNTVTITPTPPPPTTTTTTAVSTPTPTPTPNNNDTRDDVYDGNNGNIPSGSQYVNGNDGVGGVTATTAAVKNGSTNTKNKRFRDHYD